MKTRSGFVSNSSSSSFCIMGTKDEEVCDAIGNVLTKQGKLSYADLLNLAFDSRFYGSLTPNSDPDLEVFYDVEDGAIKVLYVGLPLGLGNADETVDLPNNIKPLKDKAAKKIAKLSGVKGIKVKLIYGESNNE